MEEEDLEKQEEPTEPVCARCGFRSYNDPCPSCGAPIVDKSDDEDEEYDWREKKR